ncbi:phosphotriesterase family protein [Clostridium paridis]|uniref:Phosphotriesterase n=1 Tax=Clostridium paridis TaxID=2803863 RepID=A0A937FJL3_9CLOT|nr:phosphotriesterase [Clostridium paridis]MBL4933528.1 phosphotriesterase [Clostridium paridis]
MINTVLGKIKPSQLGITLMHEHIIWDWSGAENTRENLYSLEEVVTTMEPYLLELKKLGCQTLVEATACGSGRDVEVLKACAEKTGLNIITNCGAWDGGKHRGKFIPDEIRNSTIDEISAAWINEFVNGIDGTSIYPGFIKLALGDEGFISELQEKLLRSAARTSLATGLPIECHIGSSKSAIKAVEIIEEENLPYDKFIWLHVDWSNDYTTVYKLVKKGIWVEIDAISAFPEPYEIQINLLEKLICDNLIDRLLISQDAGCYEIGVVKDSKLRSYNNIFTKFIPICKSKGISETVFNKILIKNPAKILNIE